MFTCTNKHSKGLQISIRYITCQDTALLSFKMVIEAIYFCTGALEPHSFQGRQSK